MYQGLSLNQAPPLWVPLIFFLAAPFFGLLAVCYLSLDSRFSEGVLLAAHSFFVGYVTLTMVGAYFQLLPVVAGVTIQNLSFWVKLIFGSLLLGSLGLTLGFLEPKAFFLAPLAAGGLLLFCGISLNALRKSPTAYETVRSMRLALTALLGTLTLGLYLVAGHLNIVPLARPFGTNLHLLIALGGWVGLTLVGVSFQVIPMFFVAPQFPLLIRRYWPAMIALALLLALYETQFEYRISLSLSLVLLCYSIYCVSALWVFARRRRKVRDYTLWLWRLSIIAFFGGVVGIFLIYQELVPDNKFESCVVGCGLLFGFSFLAAITAMINKIIPFLIWFHLNAQQRAQALGTMTSPAQARAMLTQIPTMKEIISDRTILFFFWLILISELIWALGLASPPILPLAKLGSGLIFGCQIGVVVRAFSQYSKISKSILNSATQ